MHKNALMVVIDPTRESQPAFEHALQSAKMTSRKLHLFACVNFDAGVIDGAHDEAHQQAILAHYQKLLQNLQQRAESFAVETSIELVWQQNWQQAVVDATGNRNFHMIFKTSQVHKLAERSDTTADWALLRASTCPVLLMHHNSSWANRRVLAAINLASEDEAHQLLNEKILAMAHSFQNEYGADVHYVNAINRETTAHPSGTEDDEDLLFCVLPADFADRGSKKPQVSETMLRQHCAADAAHIHLQQGDPVDVILAEAEKLAADLIIAGTIARTGIKGRILGNTAEKLLDRIHCDLLVLT